MRQKESALSTGQLSRLKHQIHKIKPYLHLQGTWRIRDGDGEIDNPNNLLQLLRVVGAVEKIDYERHRGSTVYVYRWNEPIRKRLAEYWENLDTLPCGHTGMTNLSDGEYSCSNQDCEREYSQEVIEECLF